ncbi:4Fe-4S binding protein, partial [Candidatus Aerophobetes bacterium]|nr:4Fe-4S binding protein [Candidatus Aerophobetes bacterium]
FNPLSVEIIREAFKRGLGEVRIEKIEIVGEKLACVKVDNFELVSGINTLLNNMPYPFLVVGRLLFPLFFKVEPSVDKEKCRACLVCALHCPVGAIEDNKGSIRINRKKCIRCFCCQEFCPHGAIKIRHSFLAKRTGV